MASALAFVFLINLIELITGVAAQAGAACSKIPDNCTVGFHCQKLVANGVKQNICVQDGCFPGDALVYVHDGGLKAIKELRIGDKVAAGRGVFSEVYAFGHRDSHAIAEFVQVQMDTTVLEVTSGHFVPVHIEGKLLHRRARDLEVGDVLSTVQGFSNITGISKVKKLGLYNPFTLSGNILVNSIVVSVHSEWFLDYLFDIIGANWYLPHTYQFLLSPIRVIYKVAGKELYSKGYGLLELYVDVADLCMKYGGSIAVMAGLTSLAMATHSFSSVRHNTPNLKNQDKKSRCLEAMK